MAPAVNPPCASRAERSLLLGLRRDALRYFLDNQLPAGLVLDRQANRGRRRRGGLCSLTATGMGLIAFALACRWPHRLLTRSEAAARARRAASAALALPHTRGALPHFVESPGLAPVGIDRRSTIDTAWLVAGAQAAAALLRDAPLRRLADQLADRLDWDYWAGETGLISHGHDAAGRFLGGEWDRLNGETAFLYVLAAGRSGRVRLPCDPPATAAGLTFPGAGLGLFVSQYSLELLDLRGPAGAAVPDLAGAAGLAADADRTVCRGLGRRFETYRLFWGLSAGDGPGVRGAGHGYRAYAPGGPIDGTAHVTATLASVAHRPAHVWENLQSALACPLPLRGRYGFSNVNLDRAWASPDVVGIDLGAVALALDNALCGGRVRRAFGSLGCVARGLRRLGLGPAASPAARPRLDGDRLDQRSHRAGRGPTLAGAIASGRCGAVAGDDLLRDVRRSK
jgi:hypothetical protein